MTSIKDVAELATVSMSTVSHVMRGTKYVSQPLKKKILRAIKKLDYHIDTVASSLRSKNTRVLGVVIPNIRSIFFPQVVQGIQDHVLEKGYKLTFYSTDFDQKRELEVIRILQSSWVDGIILDSQADFSDGGYIDFLSGLGGKRKQIPVVSLERKVENGRIRSVRIDNYRGACLSMQHLWECGCRNVAHIAGPRYCSVANERRRGYRDELSRQGGKYDRKMVVEGNFSPQTGYNAMCKLLGRGLRIDGVLAANDQMAIGAMRAIKEEGIRIPQQIKIVGFDNVFVATIVEPSLTTIAVPRYEMGYAAAELLIRQIEGEKDVEDVLLPIQLIVRRSTKSGGDTSWDLASW